MNKNHFNTTNNVKGTQLPLKEISITKVSRCTLLTKHRLSSVVSPLFKCSCFMDADNTDLRKSVTATCML